MNEALRVLCVEDLESDSALIQRFLEKALHTVIQWERVENAAQMRAALARQTWDVVISDNVLPEFDGPGALKLLHETGLDIPFIVVSGAIGEDVAVEMMRSGAHDYILKDNLARLPAAVGREIGEARLRLERRQALESLRQREALLGAVCDNTADYIVLKDLEGRIVLANPAALRAIGKAANDVIGKTDFAVFPDAAVATAIVENDRHVMEQGDVQIVEEIVQTAAGRRDYISTKAPWRDGAGRVVGVVTVSRDVTERKQAQEKLLRSELRERERANELEAIMDAIPTATFISRDPECRTILGSRRTYETLRMAAGTNLSKGGPNSGAVRLRIMHAAAEVAPENMPMQVAARTGKPVDNYSCEFILEDGVRRHMLGNAVPLFDGNGQLRGAVGAFTDVTDLKQMEGRLREVHRLESIGLLAGGIAHDFNNILTAVTGNISLALDDLCPNCHVQSLLQIAVESTQRAAGLTRQLLAYAGKGALIKKQVSATDIGHEAAQHLRASTPENIEIQTDFAASVSPVMMDPGQMHQIFTNLILNSAEAIGTTKRGVIGVATKVDGGFVRISVSDNGSGMDEAVKGQMFEPFFTTRFVGRGLGLAAVHGIVQAAGGRISVDSALGQGTRIDVYLPVSDAVAAEVRPRRPVKTWPQPPAGAVLVADDEPYIRKMIGAFLTKHRIPFFEASTGREAIERVKTHGSSIRAVVLDVAMPEMRGDEALPGILELQPDVQIIVSSGYHEADISRHFVGSKIRSFLPKPFTCEQLLDHVLPALGAGTTK